MIGYHDAGAIGSVLSKLSDAMIERKRAFADGETINLAGKYLVKIIDANPDGARQVHDPGRAVLRARGLRRSAGLGERSARSFSR
jgi:hypothetical protein